MITLKQNHYHLDAYFLCRGLTTTFAPEYDSDISVDFAYGKNTWSANFEAGFDEQHRVKFTQSANFNFDAEEIRLDGSARLEVPYKVNNNAVIGISSNKNDQRGNNCEVRGKVST